MLDQNTAEHLPCFEQFHILKKDMDIVAVDLVLMGVEEEHPVAEMSQADSAGEEMVEQVVEDVEGVEVCRRCVHLDSVEFHLREFFCQSFLRCGLIYCCCFLCEMVAGVSVHLDLYFSEMGGEMLSPLRIGFRVDPVSYLREDFMGGQ